MPEAQKLPRGRHGLTREAVAESQRERLLRAMAEAVAERGYVNTPVAEVLARAHVSRESFYEHFANKEDCFLAAYDFAAETVMGAMAQELGQLGTTPPTLDTLDAVLGRYLDALADEQAMARTFLVEAYAAGPAALARRTEIQGRFGAAVAVVLDARTDGERFACEALVAAVSALTTQRVAAGDFAGLRALRAPLMDLVAAALERRDAR
jgi:AcrR family transcriptional regulator